MERERVQHYVASLEQVIRNTRLDLRETMAQLQGYSQWFAIERTVPTSIVTDIRKTYKGLHDQLIKIKGIDQLLQSRYRQYYRRDPLREKEISELGILSKNLYSRFESMLQNTEERNKANEKEEDSGECDRPFPYQWFRSMDNQVVLLKNLRGLRDLDYIYKMGAGSDLEQRRRVIQKTPRSLSLFILSGQGGLIDIVQLRMRLREYDIKERYAKDELRGALTHLREISFTEVEEVIRRFMGNTELSALKCLLLSVQSEEDLGKNTLFSAEGILKQMASGEVRTVRV